MDSAENEKSEQKNRLLTLLEKIPVFSDLPVRSRRKIFSISQKVILKPGDVLCRQDEEPDSMFILLFGKLAVRIKKSATIATINPISTIGEMGVFTGEVRSATVDAMEKSHLLSFNASDINELIEKDPGIGVGIMRKVIKILASRIQEHNVRLREYQNYIFSQEEMTDAQKVIDETPE